MRMRLALLLVALVAAVSVLASASGAKIVILHTNDIHGRIESKIEEGLLGFPYISSLIQYYRAQYEHVLVLDAGDTLHGQPIATALEGESAVVAMNAAGYDVMVAGNHDFNFGYERLLELERDYVEFTLLSANVYKDDEPILTPYIVKTFGDYTVGIFGLTTDSISTHPDNVVGLEFRSAAVTARRYVTILRETYNVDLVIALSHIGLHVSERIAAQVDGIDLCVDGHSHSRLPQGRWVGETLIVQAHEYGRYLGKVAIDMSGDRPAMRATLVSAEIAAELVEPDETIVELLQEFRAELRRRILGG